jgi:ribose transport system substrate-binding protein
MMRRTFLAAGSAAAVLAGSACNRSTGRRIGVVPKGQAHIFWQSVHAGAVKAARENKFEVVWNGPPSESDFNGQLEIIDSMINQHLDAIAIAPIDKNAMASAVDRAVHAGIPVIIFDSPVATESFTAQVATDNYQAGATAAERMAKILNGKGKIVIVAVAVGSASTVARESGFADAIQKLAPGIQIMDKRYGNADFAQSLAVTENMLTAYPDLTGIFASNESGPVGASQAIKSRKSSVKLVGFDSSPGMIADLKSGVIDSLVVQDPFRMGYDSVRAAVQKLGGGTPVKIQNLPPHLVTRESLADPEVQKFLNPDLKPYLD